MTFAKFPFLVPIFSALSMFHNDTRQVDSKMRSCSYMEVRQREENNADGFNPDSADKLTGYRLILQHMLALYIKRFHHTRRSLKGLFCEVVLPAVFIVINLTSTRVYKPTDAEPPLSLTPWLYGSPNNAFYTQPAINSYWPDRYLNELLNGTGMGIRCAADDPLGLGCSREGTGVVGQTGNASNYQDVVCSCLQGVPTCPSNSSDELPKFRSATSDIFFNLTGKDVPRWILRTDKKYMSSRFGGFEFGVNNPLGSLNFTRLSQNMKRLTVASRIEESLPFETDTQIKQLGNETEYLGTVDNIRVWFNNKAWAASVSYLNAINNIILRASLPANKDVKQFSITAINHPMNYTKKQLDDMLTKQAGLSVLHAIAVIFSMSFVPASFVIFLVEERTSKAKHLQFVSGVKPITFWLASYSWDMMNYLVPAFLVVVIFLCFGQEAYVSERNLPGMILLLLLYGLSSIPLMYPASLVFSVPSSAFVGLACANLFIGVVTTISSFVLQLFDDDQLKFIGNILSQVFLIFPHYCLGRGLIDMAQVHFSVLRFKALGLDYERSIFEWDFLGRNFLCLFIQSIVFFSFNLMLHYPFVGDLVARFCTKTETKKMFFEDDDVARERRRVEENCGIDDVLVLSGLTKIYRGAKKPAVNRLSFGVGKGECFGLLGVNGAGKSTTFKMLTGDEMVTDGDAIISGNSIVSQLDDARQNLGYCPQEDALLSSLTGIEHLQLFARLRGVPGHLLNQVVKDSLKKLNLVPYKDRCAGTYSGGNKRKLSTAIAFIGNPAVVFLDEPSSGMDPKARRSLWMAILDAVKDDRSVLLTSHSMEECQVLCTRLAIMVNGTLQCLGSAQHLKNRFGNGYMINVRCESDSVEDIMNYMSSMLPEARLYEHRYRQLIWHVKANTLPVSVLFNCMDAARSVTKMVDYSISQTTLDDVFIRFAGLQREDDEDLTHADVELKVLSVHPRAEGEIVINCDSPIPNALL